MAVNRLGHVAIRVDDMERAKAFYLGLGMKLIWDAEDWAYLATKAGRRPQLQAAGPHFAFHLKAATRCRQCMTNSKPME